MKEWMMPRLRSRLEFLHERLSWTGEELARDKEMMEEVERLVAISLAIETMPRGIQLIHHGVVDAKIFSAWSVADYEVRVTVGEGGTAGEALDSARQKLGDLWA